MINPSNFISTGSIAIDYSLGTPGFRRGTIVEIYGEEDVGKTSLTLGTISSLKDQKEAIFIDTEKTLTAKHSKHFYIKPNDLSFVQPNTAEEALEIFYKTVSSGAFKIVALDSIAGLLPETDDSRPLSEIYKDPNYAAQSKSITTYFRKILKKAWQTQTLCLCSNQIRSKMINPDVFIDTTSGGKVFKSLSATRIQLKDPTRFVQDGIFNMNCQTNILKNYFGKTTNNIPVTITYGKGYQNYLFLESLSKEFNLPTEFLIPALYYKINSEIPPSFTYNNLTRI